MQGEIFKQGLYSLKEKATYTNESGHMWKKLQYTLNLIVTVPPCSKIMFILLKISILHHCGGI